MRKLLSTTIAVSILTSLSVTSALADIAANTLPSFNNGTNVNVTTNGSNAMNVQIQGGKGGVGIANWNSFNVGKDAAVNFEFTAHNQTSLNKVSAAGGLSHIYGSLTNSGCAGCGYDATGKVILVNPNGILFGDGANINLNSFTATTFDANYDKDTNKLSLTKKDGAGDIKVFGGANIYGDKNVTLAASNIKTYAGSKISTSTIPNVDATESYGKVKLITADGVNFTYYNNGAVKEVSDVANSTDKMVIGLNGTIESGHIDIRNTSENAESEINLAGATLKATKAEVGNDGNIWLTANNKIVIDDSKLETTNYSDAAALRDKGNIKISANKRVSIANTDINAVGDIDITSVKENIAFDNSRINNDHKIDINFGDDIIMFPSNKIGNVTLTAGKTASVQNSSEIAGKNVTIKGGNNAQAVNSKIASYGDIDLISDGDMVWTDNADLKAQGNINTTANNGYLLLNDSIFNAKSNINLKSKDSVTSAKLKGSEFTTQNKINVESTEKNVLLTSTDQFKYTNSIVGGLQPNYLSLKGAENVEINSDTDLRTESINLEAGKNIVLSSKTGNVTLTDSTNFIGAEKIYVNASNNIVSAPSTAPYPGYDNKTVNLNNIQTNLKAGNDIDVTLKNVGNRENGLIAEAKNNMILTTDGTLSVSSLKSGNDMTINANKVIAGKPYTTETKLPGDPYSDRSYIEVGGEFTSNVTENNYEITESGDLTNDGNYNRKHHIQYGEDEKILLVNKRPVNKVPDFPDKNPDINYGDEVDVVKPGNVNDNTQPTPTPNPEPTPVPTPEPNPNPNPDNPDKDCEDVPTDDKFIEEQEPTFDTASVNETLKLSVNNLLNYALSSTKQKK